VLTCDLAYSCICVRIHTGGIVYGAVECPARNLRLVHIHTCRVISRDYDNGAKKDPFRDLPRGHEQRAQREALNRQPVADEAEEGRAVVGSGKDEPCAQATVGIE